MRSQITKKEAPLKQHFLPFFKTQQRAVNYLNILSGAANFIIIFLRFYLCICERETERAHMSERETRSRGRGRGRSRLSAQQGARCRAQSQDPRTMTWAQGRCLTDLATHAPQGLIILTYFLERLVTEQRKDKDYPFYSSSWVPSSKKFLSSWTNR